MFADDITLVKEMVAKHGPAPQPIVDCGGLARPCVADYQRTIDAMADLRRRGEDGRGWASEAAIRDAQLCRYLDIERPLSFVGDYVIENPSDDGGLPLERLAERYDPSEGTGIGTAILLSVLEHVDDPFIAIDCLREAMAPGGLVIVSVPFIFPEHAECGQDCWRFTPTALRHVFSPTRGSGAPAVWNVIEADWRLDIPSEAGVLDIKTGRAQAIKSCYLVARAC